METLKQIFKEIEEIKKVLQTIVSSLECENSSKLPEVVFDSEGLKVKFPKKLK